QLTAEALPLARRTLAPFGPLLWLLGGMDKGLHTLVATPRPLEPDLRAAQRDMLLGVFTLADTTVDEVMTPRLDMIAVDVAATADEVRETFHQSEHSRLPVYDGTPDNLVGIVYAKDLVPLVLGVAGATVRWQDLVRPALYVPETKTLDSQLRDFQRGPSHLAIVVDEFGGTSGLITLEDILEEIVGEIRDEHDVETPPAIRQEGDRYVVDGRASLGELSHALGAAGALPALLAQATPTFLGVFTMAVGVPLFVSAAYLVPRVVGRRWAEPIVARAVPWLERVGRALAPFIPARDPSRRTTLAAVL